MRQRFPWWMRLSVSPRLIWKVRQIEKLELLFCSTNSVKRTSLPVTVSKIDKKLEQYTHALQVNLRFDGVVFSRFSCCWCLLHIPCFSQISSKENRSGTPVLTDLTAAAEPVSSKKSLFEGGEAWNQNTASVTPSKVGPWWCSGIFSSLSRCFDS